MKENLKLKNLLKKVLENKEFESSFEDDVTSWDDNETIYEKYDFEYFIKVKEVLGEGSKTVASLDVIITDIKRDGEDYYYDWVESNYSEHAWYVNKLEEILHEELFSNFPFSIYPVFYGYDEYENLS